MSKIDAVNDINEPTCGMKPLRAEDLRPKPKLEAAARKRFDKTLDGWVGVARFEGQPPSEKSR